VEPTVVCAMAPIQHTEAGGPPEKWSECSRRRTPTWKDRAKKGDQQEAAGAEIATEP
jgi:hypothetical protein